MNPLLILALADPRLAYGRLHKLSGARGLKQVPTPVA